jgi:oligosaccharide repeat unit polymerase
MLRSTLNRFLTTTLGGIVVATTAILVPDTTVLVGVASVVYLLVVASLYRFDYLHPSFAYVLPWLMILIFSVIPISVHSRPLDSATYDLLLATVFAWLLGCTSVPPAGSAAVSHGVKRPAEPDSLSFEFQAGVGTFIGIGFVVLYAFAALNIAVAGYIPIVSQITTGDSHYLEFGVPSVYGAFLAYANALACFAFYVYLRGRRRVYLILFFSVLVMHVAFITRQNLITLLVEAFVIRSLALGRLSRVTMVGCVVFALVAFSLIGTLRSGDAKEIFGVQPEFMWIPTSVIWLYAYSYFNALNVDNVITSTGAPFFDGYMWQTLLPSVLRPENAHSSFVYMEVESAATASYIFPVYTDIGKGVVLWTGMLATVTALAYRRAMQHRRFIDIATYSCLFFCALLSFFVDFWLYLPVIFQLFFFWIFHALKSKRTAGNAAEPERRLDAPGLHDA